MKSWTISPVLRVIGARMTYLSLPRAGLLQHQDIKREARGSLSSYLFLSLQRDTLSSYRYDRSQTLPLHEAKPRAQTQEHPEPHSSRTSRTILKARRRSESGSREAHIAIQHSSVEVLEICVLAPLEKLLLQVSTASAVSGTWTNCTFSLGHLLLPYTQLKML